LTSTSRRASTAGQGAPPPTFSAGVVYRHVEPTEALDGTIYQGSYFFFMANISSDELGLGVECPKFGDQCLARVIAATRHNDASAITRERQRGGAPDSGQCASDEDYRTGHRIS
jgi:hypothetical protein